MHSGWGALTLNVYSVSVFPGEQISEWLQSNSVNILSTAVLCDLVIGKFDVSFSKIKRDNT